MPSDRRLHLISFDVPYPPNYGGVIDVFFKIKALADTGVKVVLHTFQYGRPESPELEQLCEKVYYYRRHIYRDPFFGRLPYIVATRSASELLQNLQQDNAPIIFEGLHCCYFLDHPSLKDRFKMARNHNIEHLYYGNLAKVERNPFKRYFFVKEAQRLKRFERVLEYANAIAAISPDDERVLGLKFKNVFYLPVFHPNDGVKPLMGKGNFALYHGNLGVGENHEAAMFLVQKVFNETNVPLVIAGNNAQRELKNAVAENPNLRLEENLSTQQIHDLISQAQVNVLPTFQSTGMKLKLINVLFQGRHCLVNPKMVHQSGLENLCHIAQDAQGMQKKLAFLMQQPFNGADYSARKNLLEETFDNKRNASLLCSRLFG